LEGKEKLEWKDIRQSRLSLALELLEESKGESQEMSQKRAMKKVEFSSLV
jgi:hypothetical protein